MTRRLADTLKPNTVPAAFDLWAGYSNGALFPPSYPGLVSRFGADKVLSISTNGDPNAVADVYDFERGDYSPPQAIAVRTNHPHGAFYANQSDWAQIVSILSPSGLGLPPWWAATLNGRLLHPAGCVAEQWADRGDYDESVIYDDNWHPGPTQGDDDMIWGSDTSDINMRIVDGRCALIRDWWVAHRGGHEPSTQQQQNAYAVWASRGGDLTLAGIIDGTIT